MKGRGLLVAVLLLVIINLITACLPKIALADETYDTRWLSGTQLVANWEGQPANNTFPNSKFALGPAAWQVTGKIGDGFYFNEAWQTASNNSKLTIGSNGCRPRDCQSTEVSITNGQGRDWLESILAAPSYGAVGPQGNFSFSLKPTADILLSSGAKNPGFDSRVEMNSRGTPLNSGVTDSCSKTDDLTHCNIATGVYSASRWINWSTSAHGGYSTQITAMPLSWDIAGKICSNATSCGY